MGDWCPLIHRNHPKRGFMQAVKKGVSPQAITIDGSNVTSTYAGTVRLKGCIADSPVHVDSVIFVSVPHHMRRAR